MVKFYCVHTNQNTPFAGWGSDSYKWSIHGEFFAVVDHIIFVVNIQVYALTTGTKIHPHFYRKKLTTGCSPIQAVTFFTRMMVTNMNSRHVAQNSFSQRKFPQRRTLRGLNQKNFLHYICNFIAQSSGYDNKGFHKFTFL